MKTPRQILLGRHRTVEPKLDRIRAEVLSAEFGRGDALAEGTDRVALNPLSALALTLWRELIWPCRRVWAALACAWLLILGLEAASFVSAPSEASQSRVPSTEDIQAIREQRRMLAHMMDALPPPAGAQKTRSPGPRSQRTMRITVA
jgi:hypothetical protein